LCASRKYPDRIFRNETKEAARQFLERLVNQNESATGLFYLFPDVDAGITRDAVAVLRIAITLRSEHYDVLVNSRVGALQHEFQAKLGWLVGNLYSRIGTRDWSEEPEKERQSNLIQRLLVDEMTSVAWIGETLLHAADGKGLNLRDVPIEELERVLDAVRPKPSIEIVTEAVVNSVRSLFKHPDFLENLDREKFLDRLRARLLSDGRVNRFLR
jgi:hypothetical protein